MKYDEYMQMKNFSEQQNFALDPKSIFKYLKQVPEKAKELGHKAWNLGDAQRLKAMKAKNIDSAVTDLAATGAMGAGANIARDIAGNNIAAQVAGGATGVGATYGLKKLANKLGFRTPWQKAADKAEKIAKAEDIAGRAGIIGSGLTAAGLGAKKIWGKKALEGADGFFQKVGSKFTSGKNSIFTIGKTAAENQAALGKKIVGGAAAGTALAGGTVYALAGSGNMDPGKYYIFDDQTGKILGSSSGYASKAEAMADRNAKFQGGRINLGSTLAAKMSA